MRRIYVTLQDSSTPSVVRKRFFTAGCAAAGCTARSKKRREPPEAARNQAPEELRTYEKHTRRGERAMHTIQISRQRSPWSTVAFAVVLAIMLTACGTNTNGTSTGGTSSDPAPNPAYATIKGYGTTFGCPSDIVVNPLPPAPNVVVTIKQSFATVTVHTGDVIEIRLPFGLAW